MMPRGDVGDDVVTHTTNPWRGALIGVGLVFVGGLLALFSPTSAHADSGDEGLLGGLVSEIASTATGLVDPVVAPLPEVRELPVVGGIVGEVADSEPVTTIGAPVADTADSLLGETVASLPVVGGLLGDTPLGDATAPVTGAVDDVVETIAGTTASAAPDLDPAPVPATNAAGATDDVASGFAPVSGVVASTIPPLAVGAELANDIVAATEGTPLGGMLGLAGDTTPTAVLNAGSAGLALMATVLGGALLLLLLTGRVRLHVFRAPPSPIYATDSSPD